MGEDSTADGQGGEAEKEATEWKMKNER